MKLTLKQAQEMMDKYGDLDLCVKKIESLPDGLVVPGCLDLSKNPITELPKNLKVGGFLSLHGTGIKSLPKDLKVGGSLDLSYTKITSLPDDLVVPGYLVLIGNSIVASPENVTVGGSLYASYAEITELPKYLKVGGSLYLNGTKITKLPDGLVVPGDLWLNGTSIKELPENLIVGGCLHLNGTNITKLPQGLKVGRRIFCDKSVDQSKAKRLRNGEFIQGKYLYCDKMLTAVKKTKKIGQYTLYVGEIPGKNIVWDGEYYAHCKTFREGIADILYKRAEDRGADQYNSVTLDTEMTVPELVTMYRVITGACKQGSESFVASIKDPKETYTVQEAIELTKGQYNATVFEKFFLR